MSNILSLEAIKVLQKYVVNHKLGDTEPDNWIPVNYDEMLQLCETAIEYYRKYWILRGGLENMNMFKCSWHGMTNAVYGEYVETEKIKKLLELADPYSPRT